jgi:hypothetical protein
MGTDERNAVQPRAGGPSMIWGVLYQMMWCLLHALRLRITGLSRDEKGNITQAVLRLEPRDGGDAQELAPSTRRVIQLKTRSRGRTWSLRDMIVDVLPDLYRAVDLAAPHSAYDFVTDAEMGGWREVYSFFGSLRHQEPGDDPVILLDDREELKFRRQPSRGASERAEDETETSFWRADRYSRRLLFEEIAERLRHTTAVPKDEPVELTRRKLWHLLGRLNFIGASAFQGMETEVDSLLLALVDHREQVPEKRNALMTWLARAAVQGADVATDELLEKHGLNVTPLTDWVTLREKAQRILSRDLELRQYEEVHDVRAAAAEPLLDGWNTHTPLLGISGESGDGKSWRLYALGRSAVHGPDLVVLVDASGDADGDLQRAADIVWQRVKGNGGSLPLHGIANRHEQLLHRAAWPWLTVLIDGVQSPREAELLALRPVEDWGVRVAITGPPDVLMMFKQASRRRVRIVPVESFSPAERDEYLRRRLGDRWINVRSDVRDTLRRPLLAGIYCDEVVEPDGWRPTDEYDLFDRMWARLSRGAHGPRTFDATRVASLAAIVLNDVAYPWPAAALQAAGIDDETVDRLFRTGWVRRTADDRFEVPHDRLLNYAVARGLFHGLRSGDYSEQHLIETVRRLLTEQKTYSGRRLGYVPMDVLHLLLAFGVETMAVFGRVLEDLDTLHYSERKSFYTELLPTLGVQVIPFLIARLETTAALGSDSLIRQQPIIDAVTAVEGADVRPHALRLLRGESPALHRAAMRLLAKCPDPAALDDLWDRHCRMQDDPEAYGQERSYRFLLYEESMAALRACVSTDPGWLERTLHAEPAGGRYVHDLAYLIAGLTDGSDTWARSKAELLTKVPPEKIRSIVINIGRYRDMEEVDRLLPLVEVENDFVGPAAVRALVRIDPGLAVEHLVRLPIFELSSARTWFLPKLLEVRRDAVNSILLGHMREMKNPWDIADAYSGSEDDLDQETLEFLLDELGKALRQTAEEPPPPNRRPLSRPFHLLAPVSRLKLLECFRRRQGSGLDRELAAFLLALGPQRGGVVDSIEQKPAMALLAKIGGPEYVRVINAYLEQGDHYGRVQGIAAAHRDGDTETVRLLAAITQLEGLDDNNARYERLTATDALAVRGEARLLVDAIVATGLVSDRANDYVTAARPFDDAAVDQAVRVTATAVSTEAELIGGVLALATAGRRDYSARVVDLLEGAAPESDLALACTAALRLIGTGDERTVRLVARQLARGKRPIEGHLTLLQFGSDSALSAALEHVRGSYNEDMVINLANRDPTRSEALGLIADKVASAGEGELWYVVETPLAWLDDAGIQQIVADERVRAVLRERALAEEGAFWIVRSKVRVIRALATFDPGTAFLAAQKAFEDPDAHDRAYYPYLLVELDAVHAAPLLLRQCVREESTAVRHAIARASAGLEIGADILALLNAAGAEERAAGCVLSGFREPDEVVRWKLQELLNDMDEAVSEASLWALRSIRRAEYARQLIAAAETPGAGADWRWVLLDSLLAVADLGDEGTGAPGWLRQLRPVLSADMWTHAWEELKTRRKKQLDSLKREAEPKR